MQRACSFAPRSTVGTEKAQDSIQIGACCCLTSIEVLARSNRRGAPVEAPRRAFRLMARVSRGPDLRHDLIQIPALRGLKGRERLGAVELLEPPQLAGGQPAAVG